MEARNGHNAISFLEGYEEGKKAGIKEVVEWVELHKPFLAINIHKRWEAQKKEWGIDNG